MNERPEEGNVQKVRQKDRGIPSLILGIIAIIMPFFPMLCILGIILGACAAHYGSPYRYDFLTAKFGRIMGIIGAVICSFELFVTAMFALGLLGFMHMQ